MRISGHEFARMCDATLTGAVATHQEMLEMIKQAKELLMERNHMSETEAHRYIQKCSMDSGTNIVETAQMIMSLINM